MSLEEQKITGYEVSLSALPDKIENKAAWLKSRFDARTDGEVKEKHNGLVDALKAPEAAGELGVSVEGLAADTVEEAIKEVLDKAARHQADRENPHGITAGQTGAYTKAETERRIDAKVVEIGGGDMAKAIYDPDGDGKIADDTKLPLSGGTLLGAISAPDYKLSRAEGGYHLDAGAAEDGRKIDYRLHANGGAFWLRRYENGEAAAAPLTVTPEGVCNINGAAKDQTARDAANTAQTAAAKAQAKADAAMPKTGGTFTGSIAAPQVGVTRLHLTSLDNYGLKCDTATGYNLLWALVGAKIVDKAGVLKQIAASNISGASSIRYKHDVADLAQETARKLLETRPVQFVYNAEMGDPGIKYGLIAEELEKTDKAACYYNAQGQVEGINYTMLVAPLIKLCQLQQDELGALTARVEKLEGLEKENV